LSKFVTEREMEFQRECMKRVAARNNGQTAFVDTYGCQQNEADSERMSGMLTEMGYVLCNSDDADVVIINTCAVRENAENRVFGVIGRLVHAKRRNPSQIIILAGCMGGEASVREKIKKSYRHVDAVLDTTSFWRLPELILGLLEGDERAAEINTVGGVVEPDSRIAEGMPVSRLYPHKAWVSIMYGCNNFCSYCIVPYLRGRERSRNSEDILKEIREVVADGCKDITLLGQNVNSYGEMTGEGLDFADLLAKVAEVDGDFLIRFMTSHPKDTSKKLLDTMASNPKIARHLHLPVQSGSDRILKIMNRRYNAESYMELINYAKKVMPDIVLTSDIIVGFPGETEQDFEQTLKLVSEVEYDSLFTFIYSKREGTPAAEMEDPTTPEEKSDRFNRLIELQNAISLKKHKEYVGKTLRALVDGEGRQGDHNLSARTNGGRLIHLSGDKSLIGEFVPVHITQATTWSLVGEIDKGLMNGVRK
jgi:tRNA-2-methylthio-N6-dimethylallyladenosine synthase